MRRTVTTPKGLSYEGEKCPACPVVVQPGPDYPTPLKALRAHWRVCHPGPMPGVKASPRPPAGQPVQPGLF